MKTAIQQAGLTPAKIGLMWQTAPPPHAHSRARNMINSPAANRAAQGDGYSRSSLTRFAWLSIAAAVVTIGLKLVAYRLTGIVG